MFSHPAPIRLYLLGEPCLEVNGQVLPLPQRESLLRLFARLALAIGQPLSRKTLAFSLWPEESESEALANLRRHLYLLQRALPGEAQSLLLISSQTVCWADSPACWLDVRAFERESEDLDELEEMVSLYRGDLATGVDTDEWILARREELRSRYRALLKRLSLAYLEQNQLEHALNCCRKLTEQDRWDEEAVRLQMTLETLAGQSRRRAEHLPKISR
jgi:Response regulator containing CheY-like receiver and SARP domains